MSDGVACVEVDGREIADWDSFHDAFSEAFGFSEFYGRNGDAWIDCMTALDDPSAGLSTKHVEPGHVMTLQVDNASTLKSKNVTLWEALNEMTAFVNWRRIERGHGPVLVLSYYA